MYWNQKKVLVTEAGGFIGSFLVKLWAKVRALEGNSSQ
jgi:FlaA1/EpsC-like NDP-sugar epimerase